MKPESHREKNKQLEIVYWAMELAVLYAGAAGIILVLQDIPNISFSVPAALSVSALICGILCAAEIRAKKWIAGVIAGIAAVCILSEAIRSNLLAAQAEVLYESLMDISAQGDTDVTFFMLLMAVFICVIFFMSEILWRWHWFPYTAVTVVMVGAPVFGIHAGIVSILWGLVFQLLFWTIHIVYRSGRKIGRKKGGGSSAVAIGAVNFIGAALAIAVCFSLVITVVLGEKLSNAAYGIEGFLYRSMQQASGNAKNPIANGNVSSGNNYRTGETQLVVTLTEEPGEPLYLKGFTGGEYTGGQWAPADEEALFHEIAQELDVEQWEHWLEASYFSLYYLVNTASSGEDVENQREILISHIADSGYSTIFLPYYSLWVRQRGNAGEGYRFQYYEESEMQIDWESIPEDYARYRDGYRQLQQIYFERIPDVYTDVPKERIPRLTELCAGRSFHTVDEVTAFVFSTLHSNASYTLTPGWAPLNEDIVEYFLLDGHKGYCVHFASAAALIYRLCGVPARYVSGYMLQPSDFIRQEDGTWNAEVTDESAHAWTEIFIEDYGWIPVDTTPSSDGIHNISYPGMDSELLRELILSANVENGRRQSGNGDSHLPSDQDGRIENNRNAGWDFSFEVDRDVLLTAAVIFCEAILLFPDFISFYRIREKRKIEQMNSRQVFWRLMTRLNKNGYMTGCEGIEYDFALKLTEDVPCIKQEEAERLVEIVSRAAYGRTCADRSEDRFVQMIYFRVDDWLKEQKDGSGKGYLRHMNRL